MYANRTDPGITFRRAKEFGLSRRSASLMRQRYLTPYLAHLILSDSPVALFWAMEIVEEIQYLKRHEGGEFVLTERRRAERITDEMVERARAVPVTAVIQFDRNGKAHAWCHEDKRPSLTFMSQRGLAWCAACGRYYDSIGVLQDRDGMDFIAAVKELAA